MSMSLVLWHKGVRKPRSRIHTYTCMYKHTDKFCIFVILTFPLSDFMITNDSAVLSLDF